MTDLQYNIQKSSRTAAYLFRFLMVFPLGNLLVKLMALAGLLTGSDAMVQKLVLEAPRADTLPLALFLLATCLLLGMVTYCLWLAQMIFRDISRERTPFNPIHVKRMRRIAYLTVPCIFVQSWLDGWALALQGGSFRTQLNLAYFLIPFVVHSFSFILDYACQLQAEADTTL